MRDDDIPSFCFSDSLAPAAYFLFCSSSSMWSSPTHCVRISTFVGQNVGQTVGYGIGIAGEFCPTTTRKQAQSNTVVY